MTVTSRIKDLMSDGLPRTAREIAETLEPEKTGESFIIFRAQVRHSLRAMERWGEVECIDTQDTFTRQPAFVWRWAQ